MFAFSGYRILFVFGIIFLIVGVVRLIKPELGWKRKIDRWVDVDGDARPSESFIRWSRIIAIAAIVFAVIMFFAGFRLVRLTHYPGI